MSRSDTAQASGLAGATLVNNAVQLLFTLVFTRLLGSDGYGSLAALVSAFLILLVGGQALQVAVAREVVLGRLGGPQGIRASVSGWTRRLLVATVAVGVLGALLRGPLADLVGVPQHAWAAAAIPPTAGLWLLLSVQRGVVQGLHDYVPLGASIVLEGVGRLACGLALVGAGAGVTGAYLGTPLAMVLTSVVLSVVLRRRLEGPPTPAGPARARRRSLLDLLGGARIPVVGLTLLALLQNVDVIVVRHQLGGSRAGSYAAAAVAAKAVVWVAVGIGLHLLPEVTRRAQVGVDPRPVLLRALVGVIVVATPALVIFALAPHLLLRLAFGSSLTQASSALVVLGAAMTLLAAAYLVVQYMLALGRTTFLWVLGPVALAEPFLLTSGNFNLLTFATLVLVLQAIAALALLTLGLRDRALRVLPAGPAPR